jgi:hypothetical protein
MAIVVEDGTGLANAESYLSVADADTHFANRGFALWASEMSTAEKEQALRRSADYMLQVYRLRWAGTRVLTTQALDWPRAWVPRQDWLFYQGSTPNPLSDAYYPANAVPAEVKRAQADLAYKAAGGELTPTLGRRTTREKVDVIEVEYSDSAPQWPVYKAIDDALRIFFKASASGVNRALVRV